MQIYLLLDLKKINRSSFADSLAKTILQKLNGEVEHRGKQHKVALDFLDG